MEKQHGLSSLPSFWTLNVELRLWTLNLERWTIFIWFYRLINSISHAERRSPVENFSDFTAVYAKRPQQSIQFFLLPVRVPMLLNNDCGKRTSLALLFIAEAIILIINSAIIMVILNEVKDLVTQWKDEILRTAQKDIIQIFACRSNSSGARKTPPTGVGGFCDCAIRFDFISYKK